MIDPLKGKGAHSAHDAAVTLQGNSKCHNACWHLKIHAVRRDSGVTNVFMLYLLSKIVTCHTDVPLFAFIVQAA